MKIWAYGAMVVAVVGGIGSMLGACGGGSTTGTGGAGGAGGSGVASSSSKSSSSAKSSSSVTSVASSSSGGLGSECAAQGMMCAQCCQKDFMAENQVLFGKYVFPMCACDMPDGGADGGGAVCAMACSATVCMMMNPDQACVDCINNNAIKANNKCFTDSLAACQADPMCSKLLDCVNNNCSMGG